MAQMPALATGLPSTEPGKTPDVYQRVTATPDMFGAQQGRDMQQAGAAIAQGAQNLSTNLFRTADIYNDAAADDALNQYQDRLNKLLNGDPDQQVMTPEGPQPTPGYMRLQGRAAMEARPKLDADLKSLQSEISGKLKNPDQQRRFSQAAERMRIATANKINAHADQQSIAWYKSVNDKTAEQQLDKIASNPFDVEDIRIAVDDLTHAYTANAELAGAKKGDALWMAAAQDAKQDALVAQIKGIAVSNPILAKDILDKNRNLIGAKLAPLEKELKTPLLRARARAESDRIISEGGGYETWMKKAGALGDPELADIVETRVTTEFNRRDKLVREARADARATVSLYMQDTLKSLEATGSDPGLITASDIRTAYGDRPEQAEYLIKQLNQARTFYKTKAAVALTTPAQDAEVLKGLTAPDHGAGSAQRIEQARAYQSAIDAKRRALNADPAGYVFAAAPNLMAEMQAAGADPQKVRGVIEKSLQLQSDLGVSQWNRRIMSDAQLEAIAGRFSVQPEGGENAAAVMNSLRQSYGDLWPDAVGELVRSEKLPPAVNVLGMMPPGRASTALAEALKLGEKPMKDALSKDDVKTAQDQIPEELESLRLSLGPIAGGAKAYSDFSKATELLALQYMTEGAKPKDAVRRAAQDTVLSRYTFEGTYRVPNNQPVQAVNTGAALALRELPAEIDVPKSLAGLPEAQARESYRRSVQARGFWVTPSPPYDRGLVLYDDTMSAVTVNGKPLFLTWDQLAAKGMPQQPVVAPQNMAP